MQATIDLVSRPDNQRRIAREASRAFDEKAESVTGDSHEGANQIQDPHWNKGASHEWGSRGIRLFRYKLLNPIPVWAQA